MITTDCVGVLVVTFSAWAFVDDQRLECFKILTIYICTYEQILHKSFAWVLTRDCHRTIFTTLMPRKYEILFLRNLRGFGFALV